MARASGRLARMLKASVDSLLTPAEDPRTTFADPAQQQQALLDQLRQARGRLTTSRLRLEVRRTEAEEQVRACEAQARHALKAGRDDLARLALHRQRIARQEVSQLNGQIGALQREETQVLVVDQRLAAQIEAMRSREQLAEARRSAAEAQVAVGEALSGAGATADLQLIEQIERDAEALEARAEAIEGLISSGLLGSGAGGSHEPLNHLDDDIEIRLIDLKAEMTGDRPERKP